MHLRASGTRVFLANHPQQRRNDRLSPVVRRLRMSGKLQGKPAEERVLFPLRLFLSVQAIVRVWVDQTVGKGGRSQGYLFSQIELDAVEDPEIPECLLDFGLGEIRVERMSPRRELFPRSSTVIQKPPQAGSSPAGNFAGDIGYDALAAKRLMTSQSVDPFLPIVLFRAGKALEKQRRVSGGVEPECGVP